jgi:hypothetical protein
VKWAPPIEKECISTSFVLKKNYLEWKTKPTASSLSS